MDLTHRTPSHVSHAFQAGVERLPLRQLAQELAQKIDPPAEIFRRYGITADQWRYIRASTAFQEMLNEAMGEWAAPHSAEERIRLKSRKALEDSVVVLYEIAHDSELAPPARLDAVGRMAKLAGMDKPEGSGKSVGGSGFSINIVMDAGGQPQQHTITIEPDEDDPEELAAPMDGDDGGGDVPIQREYGLVFDI